MDAAQILEELSRPGAMPVEALRAADADRAVALPLFLQELDAFSQGASTPAERRRLFWIFHLLGRWREKSAYRPLAGLLRGPSDVIQDTFGMAIDHTIHRMMSQVFDGDPQPLYAIIRDGEADEFVRARMCETVALLAIRGELSRAEATRFLRECFSDLRPRLENAVWDGWQCAIALLGLSELIPLVKEAFRLGYVGAFGMRFKDFEGDLKRGVDHPAAPWRDEEDYAPFVDTIAELADWGGYGPDDGLYDDEDVDPDEAFNEAFGDPTGSRGRCGGPSRRSIPTGTLAATIHARAAAARNSRSAA